MTEAQGGATIERKLFEALRALTRGDTNAWAEMFRDDGVMEFPYAPPGNPSRLDGKAAIAAYMAHYPEIVSLRSVEKTASYDAGDTLIVEFSGEGTAVPTGKPFALKYVAVISHSDGRIDRYRDYWNPLVALEAMNRLGELTGDPQQQEINA